MAPLNALFPTAQMPLNAIGELVKNWPAFPEEDNCKGPSLLKYWVPDAPV